MSVETLLFDSVDVPWLGKLLATQGKLLPTGPLLNLDLDTFRKAWRQAVEDERLGATSPVPYVPVKTWGPLARSAPQASTRSRGEASRPLAIGASDAPVRSTCASRTGVPEAGPRHPQQGDAGAGPALPPPLRRVQPTGRRDARFKGKKIVEVFSGSARFSEACAQAGIEAETWDMLDTSRADIHIGKSES